MSEIKKQKTVLFRSEDGTFIPAVSAITESGTGYMLQEQYDPNGDGIVDIASDSYALGGKPAKEYLSTDTAFSGYQVANANMYSGSAGDNGIDVYKIDGKSVQDGTPTPTTPIEIQDLAITKFTSKGKNLIPPVSKTNNGITLTQTDKGICVNGWSTTGVNGITIFEETLPSGNYVINPVNGSSTTTYQLGVTVNGSTTYFSAQSTKRINLTKTSTVKITLYTYQAYGTFNNLILPYQLERGEVCTEYEAPKSATTTTNITLRSLPNGVKDTYEDGVITRRVGVRTVDSITEIVTNSANLKCLVLNLDKTKNASVYNVLCSHAVAKNGETSVGIENCIRVNASNIVLNGTADDTLETFKAKFEGTVIYYELATPTTETLDIPTLPSYYPTTNVYHDSLDTDIEWHVKLHNNDSEVSELQDRVDKIQTTSRARLETVGWYRVAEYTIVNNIANQTLGAQANSCTLNIKRAFGTDNNEYHELQLTSVHGKQEIKSLNSKCNIQRFTKVRYVYETYKAYLEVYYNTTNANTTMFVVSNPLGTGNCWRAITPTLTQETVDGCTVSCTYDIPSSVETLTNENDYTLGTPIKTIASGDDCDKILTVGRYKSNTDIGNVLHTPSCPVNTWFTMIVEDMGNGTVRQTIKVLNSKCYTYERVASSTTSYDWLDVTHQTNALTPNNFPSNLNSNNAKVVYLSPTGSDDNVGSSSEPMATLSAAINKFKGFYLLNIKLLDGEYNFDGDAFTGFQSIIIQSNSGDKSKVTVNVSSSINFYDGVVYLNKLTFKRATSTFDMIVFQRAHSIFIDSCDFVDEGGVVSYGAITFNDASGIITSCEFGGSFTNAIYAARGSQVHSYNNIAKDGSSIANGHCVNYCSVIIENCTTTLGKNYKSGGGQIISTADPLMTQSNVSNPNLLINGDFRVNQRGGTSKTTAGYFVDMWKVTAISNGTFGYDNGLSFTATDTTNGGSGFLCQTIENADLYGKTVTCYIETEDGTRYGGTITLGAKGSGDKYFYNDSQGFIVFVNHSGTYPAFYIKFNTKSSVKIVKAKLELGNVATPFTPRPYGEELALCQRYLKSMSGTCVAGHIGSSGISIYANVDLHMRTQKPSVVTDMVGKNVVLKVGDNKTYEIPISSCSCSANNELVISLNLTDSTTINTIKNQPVVFYVNSSNHAMLFSAEL